MKTYFLQYIASNMGTDKRQVRFGTCFLIAFKIILPIYLCFRSTYLCLHYLYLYAFLSGELYDNFNTDTYVCMYVFVCVCIYR